LGALPPALLYVRYFRAFQMSAIAGKTALFIDGPNLHVTAKALGFDVDFKRLLTEFGTRGPLLRAYYYATIPEDAMEYTTIRPLTDWLSYNGFTVVVKSAKQYDDGDGRRRFKRNVGVELTVDALEIARHVDEVVLFSGDGDFCPLADAIQRRGCRFTVVSSLRTQRSVITDELRRKADEFLELDVLRDRIGRSVPSVAVK
jgi:uncharacterized LabA/DUF88 family protein